MRIVHVAAILDISIHHLPDVFLQEIILFEECAEEVPGVPLRHWLESQTPHHAGLVRGRVQR